MDAAKAETAIRTVEATYEDALRTVIATAPERVGDVRQRALSMLDDIALEIEPEADTELFRLISEVRRRITQHA